MKRRSTQTESKESCRLVRDTDGFCRNTSLSGFLENSVEKNGCNRYIAKLTAYRGLFGDKKTNKGGNTIIRPLAFAKGLFILY